MSIPPIQQAIDRLLSLKDRRPLGLVKCEAGEPGYEGDFWERTTNEAIDATLLGGDKLEPQ